MSVKFALDGSLPARREPKRGQEWFGTGKARLAGLQVRDCLPGPGPLFVEAGVSNPCP